MNLFMSEENIYILFFFKHLRIRNSNKFSPSKILFCPTKSTSHLKPLDLTIYRLTRTRSFYWCASFLILLLDVFSFLNYYYSYMWLPPQVKCVHLRGPSGAVQLNVYNKAGWWDGKSLCVWVSDTQLTVNFVLAAQTRDPKQGSHSVEQ